MWAIHVVHVVLALTLLYKQAMSDDSTSCFNITRHDIAGGKISYREPDDDNCTIHFETQGDKNIIVIFPARNLSFSGKGLYRNIKLYDGGTDMNNATLLKRLRPVNRYFRGMSFSTKGSHMTVSISEGENSKTNDTIDIEITLDDCDKELKGLKGEFQTTQYPGLNGLSYPVNAYCKLSIIPFLGCSTNLHISEYDVKEVDDIFIMVGDSRREVSGPMSYLTQPIENFAIVLNASSQTDAAGGISGNYSVCYRETSSLSGQISLPFHPFMSKSMSSTCVFLIGSPMENITDVSITLVDDVTNTSSYVEIYNGFQVPRLINKVNLSEWNGNETYQSVSNETVILFHVAEENGIPMLNISYSARSIGEPTTSLAKVKSDKLIPLVIIVIGICVIAIILCNTRLIRKKTKSTSNSDPESSNINSSGDATNTNDGSFFVLDPPVADTDPDTLYDDNNHYDKAGEKRPYKKVVDDVYDSVESPIYCMVNRRVEVKDIMKEENVYS